MFQRTALRAGSRAALPGPATLVVLWRRTNDGVSGERWLYGRRGVTLHRWFIVTRFIRGVFCGFDVVGKVCRKRVL
jgi:hypothetical protein